MLLDRHHDLNEYQKMSKTNPQRVLLIVFVKCQLIMSHFLNTLVTVIQMCVLQLKKNKQMMLL